MFYYSQILLCRGGGGGGLKNGGIGYVFIISPKIQIEVDILPQGYPDTCVSSRVHSLSRHKGNDVTRKAECGCPRREKESTCST